MNQQVTRAVHVDNITKTLGGREVLKNVNFEVREGDIFGYLGPNGAGKTTTIRIILGLLHADSGEVKVLGKDVGRIETRMEIGFALDPDGLYDTMTGKENLEFYADIYEVSDAETRINKVLDLVGLSDRGNDLVGSYSAGMRQRLSLARAMVHDPKVLILDEPTSGVDPTGKIEVRRILMNISQSEKQIGRAHV